MSAGFRKGEKYEVTDGNHADIGNIRLIINIAAEPATPQLGDNP
jgi:hypothetical protein